MDALVAFQGQGIAAFFLVLSRVSGLFLFAPVFSSRLIPVRAKALIALALATAATPLALQVPMPGDPALVAVLVVKEIVVGAAIAFAVGVAFAAAQLAGSLIDVIVGFAFANVVDPLQNTQVSVMGQVYGLTAAVVFLAIDGHELLLAGVVRSFETVPVTAMPSLHDLAATAVASTGDLLAAGLEIAAPIVVTLVVTDVAMGFLARLAPQMNIFGIELPGKILAMFALLVVTAPFLVGSIGSHLGNGIDNAFHVIGVMTP